jgi:hypothetical protein
MLRERAVTASTAAKKWIRHNSPMTLGNAAAARVRLIVWCRACQHQVEPAPAEMGARYGADTSVLEWRSGSCARSAAARSISWTSITRQQKGRRSRVSGPSAAQHRFEIPPNAPGGWRTSRVVASEVSAGSRRLVAAGLENGGHRFR